MFFRFWRKMYVVFKMCAEAYSAAVPLLSVIVPSSGCLSKYTEITLNATVEDMAVLNIVCWH